VCSFNVDEQKTRRVRHLALSSSGLRGSRSVLLYPEDEGASFETSASVHRPTWCINPGSSHLSFVPWRLSGTNSFFFWHSELVVCCVMPCFPLCFALGTVCCPFITARFVYARCKLLSREEAFCRFASWRGVATVGHGGVCCDVTYNRLSHKNPRYSTIRKVLRGYFCQVSERSVALVISVCRDKWWTGRWVL
jgi:hypothetical protein